MGYNREMGGANYSWPFDFNRWMQTGARDLMNNYNQVPGPLGPQFKGSNYNWNGQAAQQVVAPQVVAPQVVVPQSVDPRVNQGITGPWDLGFDGTVHPSLQFDSNGNASAGAQWTMPF